ncbi:MAG: Ig-like domain-containing protein [Rhodothermaceae bacterium]
MIYRFCAAILLAVILVTCANPRYPEGGPVDEIAPKIIATYPENETTNFTENYIAFSFSEYVDQSSFRDAVFISPSIDGEVEYDWSGTNVEIIFHDGLRENTTYSVSVGTDVKDVNNNNKMSDAEILSFSTGDKIDKGKIIGKVYGNNFSGSMIFAYKDFPDTLNPSNTKPDYVSQVSEDGSFKLLGLAEGFYRVYAIKDEFKDLLYQTEEDMYGCTFGDVELVENDSLKNLNFMMTREDTSKPGLSEVTMIDKNHIIVKFDEAIDSSKIDVKNFAIIDTVNNIEFNPRYFRKGKNNEEFSFVVTDSLENEGEYTFRVDEVFDKNGNVKRGEVIGFIGTNKVDTNKVSLVSKNTGLEENQLDDKNPYVVFQFNDVVTFENPSEVIKVKKGGQIINQVEYEKIDDAAIKVKLTKKLRFKETVEIEFDIDKISDAAGNKCDSIKVVELKVIDGLNFSGASGTVLSGKKNLVGVLSHTKENILYQLDITKNKFSFEKVVPGKYLLWIYEDSDSNKLYDYGKVFPFKHSEEFIYYPDTLELKARWPVGDIEINF